MGLLTIKEIAEMMDGEIIDGDPCITINAYSYDSREGDPQTLFLPIVGERTDGHDHISGAAQSGMIATLTERGRVEENTEGMTYISVDSTRDAIQRLGARYRSCYNVRCVGITGSVGKSSTKEMVASALDESFRLIKTEGNKNGQLGLPLMTLKLEDWVECMVLEMGVSIPGEMERLARIAKPDIALLTNIGYSHVGNYGSRKGIRKEKLNIISCMDEGGILLINGDDELLGEIPELLRSGSLSEEDFYPETIKALEKIKIYTYGFSENCDFRAVNIKNNEAGTEFELAYSDGRIRLCLGVKGEHNVLNAAAAMASAILLKADISLAAAGLLAYRPMAMRGNVEMLDNGICLIDDSYNASPDSVRSGLTLLNMQEVKGRRIAVLGDMFELGNFSEECHREVGRYAASSEADLVIAVGEDARFIAEEAGERKEVIYCRTKAEAEEKLKEILTIGDLVLCKGSRGMHLDETANMVRAL